MQKQLVLCRQSLYVENGSWKDVYLIILIGIRLICCGAYQEKILWILVHINSEIIKGRDWCFRLYYKQVTFLFRFWNVNIYLCAPKSLFVLGHVLDTLHSQLFQWRTFRVYVNSTGGQCHRFCLFPMVYC